jgi:hypothetical protein
VFKDLSPGASLQAAVETGGIPNILRQGFTLPVLDEFVFVFIVISLQGKHGYFVSPHAQANRCMIEDGVRSS